MNRLSLFLLILLMPAAFGCAGNASRHDSAAAEWTPLFNGTDLTGWSHVGDGRFVVENGIVRTEGGMGLLWYTGQKFENSVIRIVYRNPGGVNSGVFIRIPEEPAEPWMPVNRGYEVQIEDQGDVYHRTGVLYSLTEAKAAPGKPEEWNVMEITLAGDRTMVHVNGELVTDYSEGDPVPEKKEWYEPDRGRRPTAGYVGLQNHGEGEVVYFREVSVRPLAIEHTARLEESDELIDLSTHFESVDGAGSFILLDGQTGRRTVYNPERVRTRFIPASTFKIPNTLIALETGVADGPEFSLPYDSLKAPRKPWWPESWTQEQTLRRAFSGSIVWYYQELARRIGAERMQAYVDQFDYGNREIEPAVDSFWLSGSLAISPEEQVDFLRRFYEGDLGLSERTTALAKEIMLLSETPEYRISGKTGTMDINETRELGWLVGFVERSDSVYYYALNMEGERVWEDWPPQRRIELVRAILRELDVVE